MKRTSLVDAKAHLSELVDAAEHLGKKILILRHGKPAAALVPADLVSPVRRKGKVIPEAKAKRSVRAFIAEFTAASADVSAVEDLLRGRR